MNKKKLILSIGLSVLAVAIIALCYVLIAKPFASKCDGVITVEYVSVEGEILKSKEIEFFEGDTMDVLLKENFNNVSFENGMIMTIEDYVTPSDWHTFISVYVNDEMSMVGLLEVQFEDGTKISLKITEYVWN